MFFSSGLLRQQLQGEGGERAREGRERGRRHIQLHMLCPPPYVMPRGACPSLRSFSAWAQCAEVGKWRKRAAGEGEAVQEGRLLGQLRQAFFGLFCLTEMSNSAGQEDRIR